MSRRGFFEWFADTAVDWSSSWISFAFAVLVLICWALSGPYFGYSTTWQLVVNTGTTIVTFLLGFLILHAQQKRAADDHAEQLKQHREILGAIHDLVKDDAPQ